MHSFNTTSSFFVSQKGTSPGVWNSCQSKADIARECWLVQLESVQPTGSWVWKLDHFAHVIARRQCYTKSQSSCSQNSCYIKFWDIGLITDCASSLRWVCQGSENAHWWAGLQAKWFDSDLQSFLFVFFSTMGQSFRIGEIFIFTPTSMKMLSNS